MSDLLVELHDRLFTITLNRLSKHNAFDDQLLVALKNALDKAVHDNKAAIILLKANGAHFSAGADLEWMRRVSQLSETENKKDALLLARVMHSLNKCPKPTLAVVQGAAFGGGAGLVAACDIAIAATTARFCFSEVKLGLIPAVISPYVIEAIGERAAKWLFMSAETIDAKRAKQLQLVQHTVAPEKLLAFSLNYVDKLATLAPGAMRACKNLVKQVVRQEINEKLVRKTAALIAKQRVSIEGQQGLSAFLAKKKPHWT